MAAKPFRAVISNDEMEVCIKKTATGLSLSQCDISGGSRKTRRYLHARFRRATGYQGIPWHGMDPSRMPAAANHFQPGAVLQSNAPEESTAIDFRHLYD